MSPQRGQQSWLQLPGSLVGGGTWTLEGNPRVSHSAKDPVMWTVDVSGLTTTGSGGTPNDEAVALGAGLYAGTGVGTMRRGCINCLISPNTFTSSLKKGKQKICWNWE